MDTKALINRLKTSGKTAAKLIAEKTGDVNWTKVALTGAVAAGAYHHAREEEEKTKKESMYDAAAQAVIAYAVHPAVYMGGQALIHAPKALVGAAESIHRKAREMEKASQAPFLGNVFYDNKQLYTMRQAGLAMIEQAKYNTENYMLGNEAQFLHK